MLLGFPQFLHVRSEWLTCWWSIKQPNDYSWGLLYGWIALCGNGEGWWRGVGVWCTRVERADEAVCEGFCCRHEAFYNVAYISSTSRDLKKSTNKRVSKWSNIAKFTIPKQQLEKTAIFKSLLIKRNQCWLSKCVHNHNYRIHYWSCRLFIFSALGNMQLRVGS